MIITIVAVFIFNRIWVAIPMDSLDHYLDLLSGNNTRINKFTFYRIAELIGLIAISRYCIKKMERKAVIV
jgi:hypothetical protein